MQSAVYCICQGQDTTGQMYDVVFLGFESFMKAPSFEILGLVAPHSQAIIVLPSL